MTDYYLQLTNAHCKNMLDIINCCRQHVPSAYRLRPWECLELNRGKNLLNTDTALDCYMAAYGEMHAMKCKAAMSNFPYKELNGSIEIVDWGCGQGIGSGIVAGMLLERDLGMWLKRIILVEPSAMALERAVDNIRLITGNGIEINSLNCYLPGGNELTDDCLKGIDYKYSNVIHVFSNILDIDTIDLAEVAKMVASSRGQHFIICIGPKNGNAYRINRFCSVFGEQDYFTHIDSSVFGRVSQTGHQYTCFAKGFEYNGASLDMSRMQLHSNPGLEVFDDYDFQLNVQNGLMSVQKARIAWRLQHLLAIDDILYTDVIINESFSDFVIVRPNKGMLVIKLFDHNLNLCEFEKHLNTTTNEDGTKKVTVTYNKNVICFNKSKETSPLKVVKQCQSSINDGIEELLVSTIQNSQNFKLIATMVIFTENDINEVQNFFGIKGNANNGVLFDNYVALYGTEFIFNNMVSTNLFRDLDLLKYSAVFNDAVVRKIASIVSPSWHSYQEGRIGIAPIGAQKKLVVSKNIEQKIKGVAGSGKTAVLAARAVNAMKRTGGKVLILTFNITLVNYLKTRLSELREDFSWQNVDIFNYHHFFKGQASKYNLHVSLSSFNDVSFFNDKVIQQKYAAVFVDEVQDYATEWLQIVHKYFLEPGGEFVVFGDPQQNIYNRPIDKQGDIKLGIVSGSWNSELKDSIRFKNPALATMALDFQKQFFKPEEVHDIGVFSTGRNELSFKSFEYIDLSRDFSMQSLVENVERIINNQNAKYYDYVILGPFINTLRSLDVCLRQLCQLKTEVTFVDKEKYDFLKQNFPLSEVEKADWKFQKAYKMMDRARKVAFTTDKPCLKLSTISSYKGWESPNVILLLEDEQKIVKEEECLTENEMKFEPMSAQTIYTGITRAREQLYIINIGQNRYSKFFQDQCL